MAFPEGIKRAHIVGAGGIGISAVAKLLQHAGAKVTGSDAVRNETVEELERAGISVTKGHAAENVPEGVELVVYSDAVPAANPEREEARRRGVREISYFDFIGEYSKSKLTIAVSGTNGKSTATAMLGLMLERAGFDPTVIVGSKVKTFPDRNLRLGEGRYFVVEACEYRANMLKLSPHMIVLTNIEEDHLDYYRDLAHIRETFQQYVDKLPSDGQLIINADDHVSFHELKPTTPFVTYGIDNPADYVARVFEIGGGRQVFSVRRTGGHEEKVGDFSLTVPGKYNVYNAMAAATAAMELGVPPETVAAALASFTGIWRRFERLGSWRGALVISDYGHHPSAVRLTVAGAKEFYPGRRIVLAFQPHQRNRTRKLFDEFTASFDGADLLILPEIFDVTGRENPEDKNVSSAQLAEAVRRRDADHGFDREVIYASDLNQTRQIIEAKVQQNDIMILMGAGDIYTLANSLIK